MDQPVLSSTEFRLAYSECDPAGIVYYAAYYPWFERLYNEWCLDGGFPTDAQRRLWGAAHISVASGCDYEIPGKLFDPLRVDMRLRHIGTTSFSMRFDVMHRETDERYASGYIVFVFVDEAERPRPIPVPDGFRRELAAAGCVV